MDTNVIAGKWDAENVESSVANQHGAKCVKCAWLIIGTCKSQNNMGTGWGEYCLSVVMQFEVI